MSYPENLKYTKEHEWVKAEGDSAYVGITDHAQAELGDIVFVDLPKVGATLTKGQTFGSVESVKAVSDIYAPVSGEVLETNELLAKIPEKLNGEAWLVKVKLTAAAEINDLMTAADYQTYIGV
jgi:glycine cleavage system H protein